MCLHEKRDTRDIKKKTSEHQQVITMARLCGVTNRFSDVTQACYQREIPFCPTHFYCYCRMRWFAKEVLFAWPNGEVDFVLVDLMVNCSGKSDEMTN